MRSWNQARPDSCTRLAQRESAGSELDQPGRSAALLVLGQDEREMGQDLAVVLQGLEQARQVGGIARLRAQGFVQMDIGAGAVSRGQAGLGQPEAQAGVGAVRRHRLFQQGTQRLFAGLAGGLEILPGPVAGTRVGDVRLPDGAVRERGLEPVPAGFEGGGEPQSQRLVGRMFGEGPAVQLQGLARLPLGREHGRRYAARRRDRPRRARDP